MARWFGGDMTVNRPRWFDLSLEGSWEGGGGKRGRLEVGRGKCGEHSLHLVKGGQQEPI